MDNIVDLILDKIEVNESRMTNEFVTTYKVKWAILYFIFGLIIA